MFVLVELLVVVLLLRLLKLQVVLVGCIVNMKIQSIVALRTRIELLVPVNGQASSIGDLRCVNGTRVKIYYTQCCS